MEKMIKLKNDQFIQDLERSGWVLVLRAVEVSVIRCCLERYLFICATSLLYDSF